MIIEPKLVVEREEFCHVLLLVVKAVKELGMNYCIKSSRQGCRAPDKREYLVIIRKFFVNSA